MPPAADSLLPVRGHPHPAFRAVLPSGAPVPSPAKTHATKRHLKPGEQVALRHPVPGPVRRFRVAPALGPARKRDHLLQHAVFPRPVPDWHLHRHHQPRSVGTHQPEVAERSGRTDPRSAGARPRRPDERPLRSGSFAASLSRRRGVRCERSLTAGADKALTFALENRSVRFCRRRSPFRVRRIHTIPLPSVAGIFLGNGSDDMPPMQHATAVCGN